MNQNNSSSIPPIVLVDKHQVYFFYSNQSLPLYNGSTSEGENLFRNKLKSVGAKYCSRDGTVGLGIAIPKNNKEKLQNVYNSGVLDSLMVALYRQLDNFEYSLLREGSLYWRDRVVVD